MAASVESERVRPIWERLAPRYEPLELLEAEEFDTEEGRAVEARDRGADFCAEARSARWTRVVSRPGPAGDGQRPHHVVHGHRTGERHDLRADLRGRCGKLRQRAVQRRARP